MHSSEISIQVCDIFRKLLITTTIKKIIRNASENRVSLAWKRSIKYYIWLYVLTDRKFYILGFRFLLHVILFFMFFRYLCIVRTPVESFVLHIPERPLRFLAGSMTWEICEDFDLSPLEIDMAWRKFQLPLRWWRRCIMKIV